MYKYTAFDRHQIALVTFFKFTKLVTDVLKAQDVTDYIEEGVLLIIRDTEFNWIDLNW